VVQDAFDQVSQGLQRVSFLVVVQVPVVNAFNARDWGALLLSIARERMPIECLTLALVVAAAVVALRPCPNLGACASHGSAAIRGRIRRRCRAPKIRT
jgi:hypothetical protein